VAHAHADLVVTNNNNALALADALFSNTGQVVTSVTLSGQSLPTGQMSSGIFLQNNGPNQTYGVPVGTQGVVLSSGNAADYKTGPNTSAGNTTAYGAQVAPNSVEQMLLNQVAG